MSDKKHLGWLYEQLPGVLGAGMKQLIVTAIVTLCVGRSLAGSSFFTISTETVPHAVMTDDIEVVKAVTATNKAAVNARSTDDGMDWPPLHYAANFGRLKIAELLIERGASVTATDRWGHAAIHEAVIGNHLDLAKLLVKHYPNVNLRDNLGQTPLFLAARKGYDSMVNWLLTQGAEININDAEGKTPLFRAAFENRTNTVELLLNKGARLDVFAATILGKTNELTAILKADPELANEKSGGDWRPLHFAAAFGQVEATKILIAHKAEVNARDSSGFTPLHAVAIGARPGHVGVAEILLANGANPDAKSEKWGTALDLARSIVGDKEVAKLLGRKAGSGKSNPDATSQKRPSVEE